MRYTAILLCLMLVLFGATVALADDEAPEYTHQDDYFEHYEGTATCLECHEEEATAFFHSQHYQWEGEAPGIVGSEGQKFGKMNTINDFCTNPKASWIGEARNSDGKVLSRGCSQCHAGLGKLPSATLSREQLENIDCLFCHVKGYRRSLYKDDDGQWEWRPILWNNQEGMDEVSKRISAPTRTMCLRCHSGSGGGQNYKRGDLEYALRDCSREFDVHMASSGENLTCANCHAGGDHRVRGRGTDLAGTDLPGKPINCDGECHGPAPHKAKALNHHCERIYCTVCHIPEFAKEDPTDMFRDWSTPVHNEELNKYTATIRLESNVQPALAWFNGMTKMQFMGQPVTTLDDGTVGIMIPEGSRDDENSRLYAFKLRHSSLPILKKERWLIPIAVESYFVDGDVDHAVSEAAELSYGIEHPEYDWVKTTRYMGIFHEVQPKEAALGCLDCHSEGGRVDWTTLGYEADPMAQFFE